MPKKIQNTDSSNISTQQQDSLKKQKNKESYSLSLWVRNFVAICNSFPAMGKGFIFIVISILLLNGKFSPDDLIGIITVLAPLINK